uniref:Uncharacterized protein n=1 Tax=viral metagenome TaxID=1070528 RepID=A0A6M3KD25_9ZZZZ
MGEPWSTGQVGVDVANHSERHEDGGADEIEVTGLSGLLADDQHFLKSELAEIVCNENSVVCNNNEVVYNEV